LAAVQAVPQLGKGFLKAREAGLNPAKQTPEKRNLRGQKQSPCCKKQPPLEDWQDKTNNPQQQKAPAQGVPHQNPHERLLCTPQVGMQPNVFY
jgi:hypothetical protein